jgi:hypothetical protein
MKSLHGAHLLLRRTLRNGVETSVDPGQGLGRPLLVYALGVVSKPLFVGDETHVVCTGESGRRRLGSPSLTSFMSVAQAYSAALE